VSDYVLDASAVLALLNQEQGADRVAALLPRSVVSAVNACEVVSKLVDAGMSDDDAQSSLELLKLEVVTFDLETAFAAAGLIRQGRKLGLSLGDRCCLALALLRSSTAVTAARAWSQLDVGIELEVIH